MNTKMFVNLPVKDLNKTKDFFSALGFAFNPQFTNDDAACMVIGDDNYVMFLREEFFKTFTKKTIIDSRDSTEVIVALDAESREKVNELVNKAFAAGAKPYNDPYDHGFMYGWSFQDPDYHLWEVFWMDPNNVK